MHPPTGSETAGFISVLVTDSAGPPVPDVEVRIAPLGLTATTDAQGHAVFEAAPGDYFVDANLCCAGAGLIVYHVPVTVTARRTETVELRACLACV